MLWQCKLTGGKISMKARNILITLSYKYKGDWDCIFNALQIKEELKEEEIVKCDNAITIMDEEYPDCLKQATKPPFVLFYKGNKDLLKNLTNAYCVLGDRNCTDDGAKIARDIVDRNKGNTLISGNAKGIQANACRQEIANDDKLILVIANGIEDSCYPQENADILGSAIRYGGLVLSEYPTDTSPNIKNFPLRNRIISALSTNAYAVEISKQSGSLITISDMLAHGKDIYAVPQTYDSVLYNNRLIDDGAHIYYKERI